MRDIAIFVSGALCGAPFAIALWRWATGWHARKHWRD